MNINLVYLGIYFETMLISCFSSNFYLGSIDDFRIHWWFLVNNDDDDDCQMVISFLKIIFSFLNV